ncbi:MAG: hypothetical protein ABI607_15680 [Betaproteobacteria bacterium]
MNLAIGMSVSGGANALLDNPAAEALMKKDGCAACPGLEKIDTQSIAYAKAPGARIPAKPRWEDPINWR